LALAAGQVLAMMGSTSCRTRAAVSSGTNTCGRLRVRRSSRDPHPQPPEREYLRKVGRKRFGGNFEGFKDSNKVRLTFPSKTSDTQTNLNRLHADEHLVILIAGLAALVLLGGAVAASVIENGHLRRIEVGRKESLRLRHNGGAKGALSRGGAGRKERSDSRSRSPGGNNLAPVHLHGDAS
jgi:hypothetical protein